MNEVNIVTYEYPYPAGYGGLMEVYYKIRYLAEAGVKIHLHSFFLRQQPDDHMKKFVASQHFYPRKKPTPRLHNSVAYIIQSRKHPDLLKNLLDNEAPIIFDGLHTTAFLNHPDLSQRKKLLRAHNVEQYYYRGLSNNTPSQSRKIYYKRQSQLISKAEASLKKLDKILTLSTLDEKFFKDLYPEMEIETIPAFHPFSKVQSSSGMGDYCLFQANLSIADNHKAALFLIEQIFSHLSLPLIIAGRNPSLSLIKKARKHKNIELIVNPSDEEMEKLLRNTQLNIMPSYINTGMKLKILHALHTSRHCLVNHAAVAGSGMEELCYFAESKSDFMKEINYLFSKPFTAETIKDRQTYLNKHFNNKANAELIRQMIQ